jgi:hypothetical protein
VPCHRASCPDELGGIDKFNSRQILERLKEIIRQTVQAESYHVDACCNAHQAYWISAAITMFLRVRILHCVRVRNREIKELAEKRKHKLAQVYKQQKAAQKLSRKTKKIKHL